jgi:2-polyprenyl-3-methyl-5-hydroxy-6-metoxy-1,4-benzoquinol methylase
MGPSQELSHQPKREVSKMTATFWDQRSRKYDDDIKKHDSIYVKTIETTKSLLTEADVVLDFACASGEMSLDIAPYVQQVHGIDLSGKMIELAHQKARDRQVDNITFDQIDVFDQRLVGHSFSAIIAFNIFHLLDDAPKVLAQLNDLLAAGGLLIAQTPCLGERGWLFRSLVSLAQKSGKAPPILNFTITELEALVSNSNFEISETKIWDEKNAVQWIVARKI